ncbi:MAG: hypothetical protein E7590_08550 [Ruminococcaceae bacterium]|nr:hypothetical protein [Oscillospiraceae bacterium]
MNEQNWALLSIFGEAAEGGNEASDPTPQTETGENEEAPAAGEANTARERQERFRAMMEGEYKDLFTAYFQETFNRRFREQKEMKEEFEKNRATIQAAADYFGVQAAELPQRIREAGEARAAQESAAAASATGERMHAEIAQAVAEAMRAARGELEQQILGDIRARGLRPGEGALSDGSGDALRRRAGSLSRAERAELARRAAKGEEIKF